MTDTAAATIRSQNSHEIVATVLARGGDDGKPESSEGLTITGWLSDTEDGGEIAGTNPVTLTARTTAGYRHEYAGLVPKADVNTATSGKSELYEVVSIGGELRSRLLTIIGPSAP